MRCLLPLQMAARRSACYFSQTCRFHHIKSFTKRKHIVQWADELHLGGYSKPGFPGGRGLSMATSSPSTHAESERTTMCWQFEVSDKGLIHWNQA